ncbi:hypothetical protein ACFQ4O_08255 [Methylopila musalis]|uniref:Integrase catalytic domain-containing protein n=1 Tax=Methylopila musalis TaxID=1134781 RepID=A0ABW3Z6U3_9HYPH
MLEAWRRDCNEERLHSKLGWVTSWAYDNAILEIPAAIDNGSNHDRTLASAG